MPPAKSRKKSTAHFSSHVLRFAGISLLAAFLAVWLGQRDFFQNTEQDSLDLLFKLRRTTQLDREGQARGIAANLMLVAIQDTDIAQQGPWPWPREYQTRMLVAFSQPETLATGIGYDILFASNKSDKESVKSDTKFIEKVRSMGNVCLAGRAQESAAIPDGPEGNDLRQQQVWQRPYLLPPLPNDPGISFVPTIGVEGVAPMFHDRILLGLINAPRDPDGVIRHVPVVVRQGDSWLPSLSLRMAMAYHKVPLDGVTIEPGHAVVLHKPDGSTLRIPVEGDHDLFQTLRINYRGTLRWGDFHTHSFSDLANWADPKKRADPAVAEKMKTLGRDLADARGGVVLVGHTSTGSDIGPTPLDVGTALIDVHLNALNNMMQDDFLRVLPGPAMALLTLLLSALAVGITMNLSAVRAALAGLALLLVFLAICWLLFLHHSLWIPALTPCMGLAIAYMAGTTLQFTGEERQRKQVRAALQNYLSANIMEEVLQNPEAMRMGGVRKELTVLFTDVRGFTTFCENHPPEQVVPLLNELLETVSEVVIRHDGTLDKYIGDAVMAFWGAPASGKLPHAEAAARAALDMAKAMTRLHADWKKRGLPQLPIGIGLNTGDMLVGNIGSSRLRNYTVIGDAVNLAARLEGETRKFDAHIILSESTREKLGASFKTRPLGEVTVKGKAKSVKIFALEDGPTGT